MGPFTLQVLAARQRIPPDTDTPRDWCNAQQTSTARPDPEQPQKVRRAGHQGHHYHRPGSCGLPLPAVGRVTTEKSPGMSQAAWNSALHCRGDIWWWLPAPTPSGDNSQLCLSARNRPREQAALRKGVLQAEGLSPGLSVQASLPRVTAYHSPNALLTAGAASFFSGSGTRALGGACRHWARYWHSTGRQACWRLSGHSHPAAEQLHGGTAGAQAHRGITRVLAP